MDMSLFKWSAKKNLISSLFNDLIVATVKNESFRAFFSEKVCWDRDAKHEQFQLLFSKILIQIMMVYWCFFSKADILHKFTNKLLHDIRMNLMISLLVTFIWILPRTFIHIFIPHIMPFIGLCDLLKQFTFFFFQN